MGQMEDNKEDEKNNRNRKSIFQMKSKEEQAKERFAMSASEYLEHFKVGVYLQDAIKIILD